MKSVKHGDSYGMGIYFLKGGLMGMLYLGTISVHLLSLTTRGVGNFRK